MPENDDYPQHRHGTFAPVGIALVVAIGAVLVVFLYERSGRSVPPSPNPTVQAPAANPNTLAPPGAGSQSPVNPPAAAP